MNSSMNVHARPDLRRSQLTHLAAGLFMFSIPLVLIALPLVLLGLHEGKAARLIEREGHDAEATIERMWTTRKRRNGVGSTGSPVEYHLRYRFQTQAGDEMTSSTTVTLVFYSRVGARIEFRKATDPVPTFPVRYAISNPKINEIEPGALSSGSRSSILAAGIIAFLCLSLMAWWVRGGLRAMRRARPVWTTR